jgi:hypothetical protein
MISNDLEEDQILHKEVCDQNFKLTPKSCVSLASLYTRDDQNNIPNPLEEPYIIKFQESQKLTIGTPDFPKYINLGTSCIIEEINQYT